MNISPIVKPALAELKLELKRAGNKAADWFIPPIVIPALLIVLIIMRMAYLAI